MNGACNVFFIHYLRTTSSKSFIWKTRTFPWLSALQHSLKVCPVNRSAVKWIKVRPYPTVTLKCSHQGNRRGGGGGGEEEEVVEEESCTLNQYAWLRIHSPLSHLSCVGLLSRFWTVLLSTVLDGSTLYRYRGPLVWGSPPPHWLRAFVMFDVRMSHCCVPEKLLHILPDKLAVHWLTALYPLSGNHGYST